MVCAGVCWCVLVFSEVGSFLQFSYFAMPNMGRLGTLFVFHSSNHGMSLSSSMLLDPTGELREQRSPYCCTTQIGVYFASVLALCLRESVQN